MAETIYALVGALRVAGPLQSDLQVIVEWLLLLGIPGCFGLGLRQTFLKADRAGWKALIPGYNLVVGVRMIGYTSLWALPSIGTLARQYAECFGKGKWYGVGLTYLPFFFLPILGYGTAEYRGPVVDETETRRVIERHKQNARLGMRGGMAMFTGMVSGFDRRHGKSPYQIGKEAARDPNPDRETADESVASEEDTTDPSNATAES